MAYPVNVPISSTRVEFVIVTNVDSNRPCNRPESMCAAHGTVERVVRRNSDRRIGSGSLIAIAYSSSTVVVLLLLLLGLLMSMLAFELVVVAIVVVADGEEEEDENLDMADVA